MKQARWIGLAAMLFAALPALTGCDSPFDPGNEQKAYTLDFLLFRDHGSMPGDAALVEVGPMEQFGPMGDFKSVNHATVLLLGDTLHWDDGHDSPSFGFWRYFNDGMGPNKSLPYTVVFPNGDRFDGALGGHGSARLANLNGDTIRHQGYFETWIEQPPSSETTYGIGVSVREQGASSLDGVGRTLAPGDTVRFDLSGTDTLTLSWAYYSRAFKGTLREDDDRRYTGQIDWLVSGGHTLIRDVD